MTETKVENSIWERLPVVILTALFCCTLWGSASPSIKIGYELFAIGADDTPSRILFAGVRFTGAGIMVILFGSALKRKLLLPGRTSARPILVLAAFQTVLQYIFFYMGLAHTSGVRGSIINAAGVFFNIAVAVFIFRFEKLTARKIIGSLIGFVGVVMIILAAAGGTAAAGTGGLSPAGEGALLLSAFFSAMAGSFIKKFSASEDPVMLSGWQFFTGGLIMIAVGTAAGGHLTVTGGACIPLMIYMCFISAGAYTLWGILLKYNPVSRVSVIGFMNPVMGVILSIIFLHEEQEAFHAASILALVLVCIGIVIVNRPEKKQIK